MSDFGRTLVTLAAAATWLGLEGEENLAMLKSVVDLGRISDAIGRVIPAIRHGRPYAPRTSRHRCHHSDPAFRPSKVNRSLCEHSQVLEE